MTELNILMVNPGSNITNLHSVKAYELTDVPIRCFAHHKIANNEIQKTWLVSEFFSGLSITSEWPTKEQAIEGARKVFEKKPLQDIKDIVNGRVKTYGFANKDGTERSHK